MALHNILGLLFPLGVALTIGKRSYHCVIWVGKNIIFFECFYLHFFFLSQFAGALAIGLFYRDRTRDLRHDNPDDFSSDFHPGPGFDTNQAPSTSSNSTADEEEKCCICLENMKRFQSLKTLPCIHKFHKKCVESWLRYEMFCPNCRTVVPS